MTSGQTAKGRIDDIEVLRGCAVLLVVLHHAHSDLITWSHPLFDRLAAYIGGWYGVDLFFAISGFVIARDLLPKLQACGDGQSRFRITVAFWIRRAWRLLPSAWLWLLLILIASRAFNATGAFSSWETNLEATVAGILQVANIRLAETFGERAYGASFAYWSLSLEEQFYIVLPLVALLAKRWLPLLLAALIVAQLAVADRSLMLLMFRSDALMLGVLLAIWSHTPFHAMARPGLLAMLPGKGTAVLLAIVLCMGIASSSVFDVISYKHSVIAVLSIVLVWIASYDRDLLITPKPLRRIMIWVGARSYAIYLIHVPAFFLAREIWFRLRPTAAHDTLLLPLVITAAVLILILAELNYRLVEMPLRRRGALIAGNFLNPKTAPDELSNHDSTRKTPYDRDRTTARPD